jgi:hypothetical protein
MVKLRTKLFSQAQSGQAIVIISIAMVAVLGFAILALDGGRYYSQRRINQNAADASSLAGIYYFSHNGSSTTPAGTWASITTSAQANGINNTSASTSDNRRVVQAYWLDSNGGVLSEFTDTTSTNHSDIPSTAMAIKVTTRIEYNTFMLGILGQKTLTAEGSSIARKVATVVAPTTTVWPYSGYFGGVGCDNGSGNAGGSAGNTKYTVEWYDGNNGGYNGDLYVHGNAAFLSTNGIDMRGNKTSNPTHKVTVTNYVDVLQGINIKHQNPNNVEPGVFFSGSVNTVSVWDSPSSSDLSGPTNGNGTNTIANAYPSLLYVNNETHPIDASDFEPAHTDQGGGASTGGYMYQYWIRTDSTLSSKWHYIYGKNNTAIQNGNLIDQTQAGIWWVDGDVSLAQNKNGSNQVSIMATGQVGITAYNNQSFGSAGDIASNISILSNKDWGTGLNCANSDSGTVTHWAINTNANQSYYAGFIYAPYGLVLFEGNGNNGHYQAWGVYSNSLRVGDGSGNSGQNMNFDYQTMFLLPSTSTGLMGNR